MKILNLEFENMVPKSKQHSGGQRGKYRYVKPEYTAWKNEVAIKAKMQAKKAKWKIPPKNELLRMNITAVGASRMDVDNLAGGIMDALIGVIYEDDRQIKSLTCTTFPKPKDEKKSFYVDVCPFDYLGSD